MMRIRHFSLLIYTLILSAIFLGKPIIAADNVSPSFAPPAGLAVDSVPQFIVLGFDDNRYVDGMKWVLDTLLKNKKNPAGSNNAATFDNRPIGAAFYYTSGALAEGGQALLDTWKATVAAGYEIGDHTVTHETGQATALATWRSEIAGCRTALATNLGIPASQVYGFRTPYLAFNDATFTAVAAEGLLYECTMTQMQDYNKSLFTWPYTLDNGFADKVIEGWVGKCKIPGLWEIPVYTVAADATSLWPPITGFDSSILIQAVGAQFEAMLKNGLDYRLKTGGNRAPMTVGLHSDTYSPGNPSGVTYDPQLNLAGRRAALQNFITYALAKPMVRFVSAKQLIDWMRNPVPLGRGGTTAVKNISSFKVPVTTVKGTTGKTLEIRVTAAGRYSIGLYTLQGRMIASKSTVSTDGLISISFDNVLPGGSYIVSWKNRSDENLVFSQLLFPESAR